MINIQKLAYHYKRRTPILEESTTAFLPGGVYGILGANGVGKTTLLHLLGGFIFPKKGEISVFGDQPKARSVAFLQDTYYVPVEVNLPAIKVSAYAQRLSPFYPKFDIKTWENALKTFDIDLSSRLDALSFGQKKKVSISFALATHCNMLLLDEPTDGLDIPSKDSFRSLLSKHVTEGRVVAITTHHIHDIASLVDHLVILKDTQITVNMPIHTIAERICSTTSTQLPHPDELVYSERIPGGYHCLVHNHTGTEGPLDLEILFKAFLSNPQILA